MSLNRIQRGKGQQFWTVLSDLVRGEVIALLKLKWAIAHPIRSARDLARFLSPQGLYSNR